MTGELEVQGGQLGLADGLDRRDFVRTMGMGAAALGLGSLGGV